MEREKLIDVTDYPRYRLVDVKINLVTVDLAILCLWRGRTMLEGKVPS